MTRNGQRLLMLIDDEPAQRRLVAAIAARRGWRTVFAGEAETAIATLGTPDGMALDAVILDHSAPDFDAPALIAELRLRRPQLPILMLTANGSVAAAVAAMRAGATDFLVKPLASERLLAALEAVVGGKTAGELRPLTEKLSTPARVRRDRRLGAAVPRRARDRRQGGARARAAADRGRERRGQGSRRRGGPCRLPAQPQGDGPRQLRRDPRQPRRIRAVRAREGRVHRRVERKIGRFQEADGGSLFLDEVGEMPLEAQVKLLRVLQSGEIQPIGARHAKEVDVRVVAATNKTLLAEVEAGRFARISITGSTSSR